MNITPQLLLPSQNFLKPDTIRFILECYAENRLDQLPPSPIVRKDDNGNFIAIDGHNLIAVKLVRNENIDVHLATHPEDGLSPISDSNLARNQDLRDKFDSVLKEREKAKNEGVDTFDDLIALYPDLFSLL